MFEKISLKKMKETIKDFRSRVQQDRYEAALACQEAQRLKMLAQERLRRLSVEPNKQGRSFPRDLEQTIRAFRQDLEDRPSGGNHKLKKGRVEPSG